MRMTQGEKAVWGAAFVSALGAVRQANPLAMSERAEGEMVQFASEAASAAVVALRAQYEAIKGQFGDEGDVTLMVEDVLNIGNRLSPTEDGGG